MCENVDLVRWIYAAWGRGDFSSGEWAHPEIEFVRVGSIEGRMSRTGLAGMAAGWRDYLSTWEEYRAEAKEYRELDDERVLVLFHAAGRGKTSGLELESCRWRERSFSRSTTARSRGWSSTVTATAPSPTS